MLDKSNYLKKERNIPFELVRKGNLSKISKVLVIDSGSVVIGQAAKFDYLRTQACQSLKKERKDG